MSWSEAEGDYLPILATLLIGDACDMECVTERVVKLIGMTLHELGEGMDYG